ncbi:MAG: hypothetical protein LBJ25_04120 [Candidatus Margulisbacteria bacterium]|jgi:hypothetical protein|nr:hypothetical protein [Candidatus Margulisiibacteriota bacterium]
MRYFKLIFGLLLFGSLVLAADTVRQTDLRIANADIFGKAVPHSFRQGRQIHLVYTDRQAVHYLRSADAGLSWDKPQIIVDAAADAQIVGNAAGRLYIFYARGGGIYMVDSVNGGGSWSAPYKVSDAHNRSQNPCAVVSGLGDIYLVWENNGVILQRRYDLDAGIWQDITELSGGDSETPLIVNYRNRALYAVWLEKGEVVCRIFDLARETWDALEQISAAANQKPGTVPANCRELAVAVDSQNNLHVVWSNGGQLLHRVRGAGLWSNAISRLSTNYISGSGSPSVAFDASGQVFIVYIAGNTATLCCYNARAGSWEKNFVFTLDSPKYFSCLSLGGNSSYNEQLPGYLRGFDIFWVEREPQKSFGTLAFNSRGESLEPDRKIIPAVEQRGTGNGLVELTLTGIDTDSLYLYSPEPSILYYSGLLEMEKDFIIRGAVKDSSSVRLITFSPAFDSRPAPIRNTADGVWSARYTIRATDAPEDIIITAYDQAGNVTTRAVSVRKDTTPPDPPTWVCVWPNRVSENIPAGEPKKGRSQQVFVTWTDAADQESGVGYYAMGNHSRWWQNVQHQSGDAETADEGENNFYVFAVDNVGNVSLPATDRIFIDSIPPSAPVLSLPVTSANYFYGTVDKDVETILINGLPDDALQIVTPGFWQYRHGLSGGRRQTVRLQAIDAWQNRSPVVELLLEVDREPPQILAVSHNAAGRPLRVRDKLIVTLRGEPNGRAFFSISGLTQNIPLWDAGQDGDARARDGVYTGVYTVDSDQYSGQYTVTVSLCDAAGNLTEQKITVPLTLDSWREQLVDDFENRGDHYPWKNHARARNIHARDKDFADLQIPSGQGALQVDYDLAGQQAWAGVASREFSPRNYYGARPVLRFWLKGSGSPQARLAVYLLSSNDGRLGQNIYNAEPLYSAPLQDTEWKLYSVAVAGDLEPLAQTVKYAVFVYSPDQRDKGIFYLDDLRVTFQKPAAAPEPPHNDLLYARPAPDEIEDAPEQKVSGANTAADSGADATADSGAALMAPYLDLELTPPVLTRGSAQTIKISVPPELAVARAYAVWGRLNGALQTTKLRPSGSGIFRGEYKTPADLQTGERQGLVFLQSQSGQIYKKPFYFRVLAPNNKPAQDLLTVQFFPHPLAPAKDIRVKALLPASIKSKQVMLFLAAEQSKIISALLTRGGTAPGGWEIWEGVLSLPADTAAGEYFANIICKTEKGEFIKKKIKYSVYK